MAWTLKDAKERLAMWLEAEASVATGQEYRIGTRYLKRVDLNHIRDQIIFWKREVDKLTTGRRGATVRRAVPRDL